MRLAFYRPVIVMTQEREGEQYEKFIPAVSPLADKTLTLEQEIEPSTQTALF
jgi:hypothetical protein